MRRTTVWSSDKGCGLVTVFTRDQGALPGKVYRKSCRSCNAVYYPSYYEFADDTETQVRKYFHGRFISATQDTLFEVSFLETVTLDVTLLSGRFRSICEKFNDIHINNSKPLDYRRLELAWIIWEISRLLPDFNYSIPRNGWWSIW